ncbi:MAG: hypothetical protein R3324_14915 [Halobacteriales archaeon]|nr:hypothetical protein [Halobacteriales archaeon]
MNRPPALAILVVVTLVLVSGCAQAPSAEDGIDQRPFPEPPERLTEDTVGEYTSEFEEVYRHNSIVAANDETEITSITTSCSAASITPIDGGFRVTVECGFGWMFESNGSAGVADGRPYQATYRVTNGLTERVDSTL